MVYAEFLAINQTVSALISRADEVNSTLFSLQLATDNFTTACGLDIVCVETVPMVPFLSSLDAVSKVII